MLISLDLSNSDINNNLTFKIILYTILNGKRIPIEGICIQLKDESDEKTSTHTSNYLGECQIILNIEKLHQYNYKIDINMIHCMPYNSLSFLIDPLNFYLTQEYYLLSL